MTFWRLVWRNLLFHRRIHWAVALGVAAATAVLTGALLVGDSVRGSLREMTLDRLGRIDELLVVDRFFREELAREVASDRAVQKHYAEVLPAILVPSATAETQSQKNRRRAAGVTLIGTTDEFWRLGDDRIRPQRLPHGSEVVLNAPLAAELQVKVGEAIILRLAKAAQIPADSALGEKTDRITSLAELKVVAIIPAVSLGRFSLQASQVSPQNAYLDLRTLQEALDVTGQVNCLLVAGKSAASPPGEEASRALSDALKPRLGDYGLSLQEVRIRFGEGEEARDIAHYFSLSSDRMMLDDATAAAAMRALKDMQPQPVLTYLANDIAKIEEPEVGQEAGIPYSMITAIDPMAGGPLVDEAGNVLPPLADNEIALNRWAAKDQRAEVGDRVRVTWFEPETTHGQEKETSAEFRVAAIVPLTDPAVPYSRRRPARYDQPPTAANDPDLTPTVKGITDQETIDNWDAPFEYDRTRIRPQDDQYWRNHRTTPKAFVSLATGQRLWGSRFGNVTSIRIPGMDDVPSLKSKVQSQRSQIERDLSAELSKHKAELGFAFQPIKRQGLDASRGTTPFDVLFLLLSMFIIAAALMLVWLLFRLGIEQRASELGLLQSLGWPARKSTSVLMIEGGLVAAAGGLLGIAGGIGYAWLMIAGLRTWWVGAIATPFLQLHMTPASLLIGYLLGVIVSLATIWFSLRALARAPARQLLAGEARADQKSGAVPSRGRFSLAIAAGLLACAVGLAILAINLGGEAQAGAFLGAGAAFLVALLILISRRLRRTNPAGVTRSVTGLAIRNAGRNAGRSVATIALMSAASFLIVAVSSFRLDPTDEGIGGFDLLAECSEAIVVDLNSPERRRELLRDQAPVLKGTTVLSFRVKPGDDASCRNLYQPSQPRILGVTPETVRYFDDPQVSPQFSFSASAAQTPEEQANPWRVLNVERKSPRSQSRSDSAPRDEPIPVILDKNTAMYSLKLYWGVGEKFSFTYADGTTVNFRVAGLLSNSILQGSLLIGEQDFQRLFPEISGYRSFLIKSPPGKADAVAAALEDRLGDEGFDASDSRERLADLLAVQNTYISTFQSLGALGLVLGTFGLAAVQLRNVLERRKELALMQAVGFRGARLGEMVLLENLFLLLAGLACGTLAALVSAAPHMLLGGARVPLLDLSIMLGIVLVVGVVTGLIAVRATLRAPILGALRGN